MRRRALAVVATVALVAGCTPRATPGPQAAALGSLPSAEQIHTSLEQRRSALRGVRAMARLSYTSPELSRKAKQLLIAERPDRLRMEIFSPFGAVFVLTTADGELAAWARDESTVYRGSASPQNLRRYAQVDLPVDAAVDVILATPPLEPDADDVVSADGDTVELWQESDDVVRVLWLTPALEPLRYEQRAADGRVLLRATFGEYATIDGQRVATQLSLEMPAEQRRLDITLSEPEVNPALADTLFALQTPAGSTDVDLDQVRQ